MDPNRLIHYGLGSTIDTSDFMRKSVYDKDKDNVVDELNKLTDIRELRDATENYVPKYAGNNTTVWEEDETGGGAIGGTL